MTAQTYPIAIIADEAPLRIKPSNYPDDDLQAELHGGKWRFTHKDGGPY